MGTEAKTIALPIKQHRLVFIDLMRGIAILWMIEAHVVNSCLNKQYTHNWFHSLLQLSNGYVAVWFIFCAGAGFWLAVEKKLPEYRALAPSLWLYLRRLLFILAIGYWLHLPHLSFELCLRMSASQLQWFLQFDVLQTIVASSLVALLLVFCVPRLSILRGVFTFIGIIVFFTTPFVWNTDPLSSMPTLLAMAFVKQPLSKFPLFPWSGYFFAGAAVMGFFLKAKDRHVFARRLAVLAFITPFIVFALKQLPFGYPGWNDWWYSSPGHSLFRLSGAILLFAILYLVEERLLASPVRTFLQRSGQESLFFYVFHLMLVYGSVIDPGIAYFIYGRSKPWEVVLIYIGVVSAVYYAATMWQEYKAANPARARRVMTTMIILFLILFLVIPASMAVN